jgi:hypothetical protein
MHYKTLLVAAGVVCATLTALNARRVSKVSTNKKSVTFVKVTDSEYKLNLVIATRPDVQFHDADGDISVGVIVPGCTPTECHEAAREFLLTGKSISEGHASILEMQEVVDQAVKELTQSIKTRDNKKIVVSIGETTILISKAI